MTYDGNGTFNRLYNWQSDALNGINIMADRMDNEMNGFAAGLSLAFLRDGQAAMIADADFGNYKLLRVGAPTLNSDGVNKAYVDGNFIKNTGDAKITAAAPFLNYEETDVLADISKWAAGLSTGVYTISPRQSDGTAGSGFGGFQLLRDSVGLTDARLIPGPNWLAPGALNDNSILTKLRGVLKTGDTMTGNLTLDNATSNPNLYLKRSANGADLKTFVAYIESTAAFIIAPLKDTGSPSGTGSLAITRDAIGITDLQLHTQAGSFGTNLSSAASVVTRQRGDARYFPLTGGDVSGQINVKGGAAEIWSANSTGNPNLWLKNSAGKLLGGVWSQYNDPKTYFRSYDNDGVAYKHFSLDGASGVLMLPGEIRVQNDTIRIGNGGAHGYVDNQGPGNLDLRIAGSTKWTVAAGGGFQSGDGIYNFSVGGNVVIDRVNYGSTRINNSGVGIYTGGPGQSDLTYHFAAQNSSSGMVFRVASNGNVQNTNNSYGAISDVRLKENIQEAKPQLEDVLKLSVVNFNMIGDDTKQIGLIAQEVMQIKPGLVEEDADGFFSIKYSVLIPIFIKAIQELNEKVEALEAA